MYCKTIRINQITQGKVPLPVLIHLIDASSSTRATRVLTLSLYCPDEQNKQKSKKSPVSSKKKNIHEEDTETDELQVSPSIIQYHAIWYLNESINQYTEKLFSHICLHYK